jgi:hypothetical protein
MLQNLTLYPVCCPSIPPAIGQSGPSGARPAQKRSAPPKKLLDGDAFFAQRAARTPEQCGSYTAHALKNLSFSASGRVPKCDDVFLTIAVDRSE